MTSRLGQSPLHHAAHGPPPRAGEGFEIADPERALVLTYASAVHRTGLAALFALDERLGAIVASTTEPTIGLMRLAWWRESIEKLATAPAPAEPMLEALAALVAQGVPAATIADIEDGWAALLDGPIDADAIIRHGWARGHLFVAGARWLGALDDGLAAAGSGWALADLGHRHSDQEVRSEARRQARDALAPLVGTRWSRAALPLAALAILARRDACGDDPRRQGAPIRLLRLLALRLFRR